MNNEAKTIDIGQGLQLTAMFAQSLRKVGLNFDEAQNLIDKPSVFRSRLKALKDGKVTVPAGSTYQFTVIEKLDVKSHQSHRRDDDDEYIKLCDSLKEKLSKPCHNVRNRRHEEGFVHKCTALENVPRQGCLYRLYPILRDAMGWHGPDTQLWNTLGERGALWTPDQVLGFLRDEVHEGLDPLGLVELGSADFPVVCSEKEIGSRDSIDPDTVGLLRVNTRHLVKQKRVWEARISLGPGYMVEYYGNNLFFADDPRRSVE